MVSMIVLFVKPCKTRMLLDEIYMIYGSTAGPRFPLWLGSFLKTPSIIVVGDYCWGNVSRFDDLENQ